MLILDVDIVHNWVHGVNGGTLWFIWNKGQAQTFVCSGGERTYCLIESTSAQSRSEI